VCSVLGCSSCHSGIFPLQVSDIPSRLRSCSLDCRHAGCFQCVLSEFGNRGTSCPTCNAFCGNPPQYDVSLERIISLVYKYSGGQHRTAESSAIDPKTFDKLYSQQRRVTSMPTQSAGPQTQATFVEISQATNFEGQTQAQASYTSAVPGGLGLAGVDRDVKEGGGAPGGPLDVEMTSQPL